MLLLRNWKLWFVDDEVDATINSSNVEQFFAVAGKGWEGKVEKERLRRKGRTTSRCLWILPLLLRRMLVIYVCLRVTLLRCKRPLSTIATPVCTHRLSFIQLLTSIISSPMRIFIIHSFWALQVNHWWENYLCDQTNLCSTFNHQRCINVAFFL